MFTFKSAALVGVLGIALAACGSSGATSASSPATPASPAAAASSPAASTSSAAASPAASSSAAASGSAASATVIGEKAPGSYSPNGSITATAGTPVEIQATEALKWQPNTIMVSAGEKVTLDVKNPGNTAHTFVSPALNVTMVAIPTGKTTTVSFTAPAKPGAYQFWCNIPGHAEAGMVGEVIVR